MKRRNKPYHGFLKQWIHTIGNLRAWPFEENRSDHADLACIKLNTDQQLEDSFCFEDEINAYSRGYKALADPDMAITFAQANMRRMLRV